VRHGIAVVGIVLALSLSGCAPSKIEAYRPKNAEEALVVSTLLKIPAGINGKSVDLLMQPYADDVYIGNFHKYIGVAGPSAPRNISKADLRIAYTQLFKSVKSLSVDLTDFQLTVSGDRAVALARLELLFKLEAGRGDPKEQLIRNDVTWRMKYTPVGWKIQEEIFE
jgi:ketosteroid isomerase-like protein